MKIIPNNILPFPGFQSLNLFGVVFVRKSEMEGYSPKNINHESIHTAQMKELLYIPFYLIYFLEWVYRLIFHTRTAYRGISFEKEAYGHEKDLNYLANRKHFAQWRRGCTKVEGTDN